MRQYRTILFDLDGTLTDPEEGITKSVQYALHKFGIDEPDLHELRKFIGPPLVESFQNYYSFSKEEALQGLQYYREYFGEQGYKENAIITGIPELLKQLKEEQYQLLIATSKPEFYTNKIVERFHMDSYFDFIAGATMDQTRTKKEDVIQYALEQMNISNKGETVMVGDRLHDILGAKKNGIDSIGVLFGYGDYKELEQAGATYIVGTVKELQNMFLE